jgi:hypothetical protein
MGLQEIGYEDIEYIHLTQDRIQWFAFVNTEMNLWVSQKAGNLLTERMLASQETLCSVELDVTIHYQFYKFLMILNICHHLRNSQKKDSPCK